LVEQRIRNAKVVSSIPIIGTKTLAVPKTPHACVNMGSFFCVRIRACSPTKKNQSNFAADKKSKLKVQIEGSTFELLAGL
jgi:hypothetical protein